MELLLTSLLIFFLPSQLGLHFWPTWAVVDYLSPTLLFTDILIFLLLIFYSKKTIKLSKNIFILLILILINIIFSLNPFNSVFKYFRLLEYALLAQYFISRPKYLYHSLINIFPLSIILVNTLAWLQFYFQHSLGGLWYLWGERTLSLSTAGIAKISFNDFGQFLRPYSTFSHPNSLAGFLLVSFCILYYLYRRKPNHLLLVSLILTLLTIPLTFSRTIILLEAFTLLLIFITSKLKYLALIPLLFLSIFIGSANSITERLSLLKISLDQILIHPFAGIGLGNFPIISSSFQPVHSLPILLLTEIGIPTTLIILALIKKINLKYIPSEILFAWLAIIISGLVDHYWLTLPQNLLLVFVLLSLTINNYRRTS